MAIVFVVTSCASTAIIVETASIAAPSAVEVELSTEPSDDAQDVLATVPPLPTLTPTPVAERWVVVDDGRHERTADDAAPSDTAAEASAPSATLTPAPVDTPYRLGVCYTGQGWVDETPTACTNPHEFEVILTGKFSEDQGNAYPGTERLRARVDDACDQKLLPFGLVSDTDVVTASSAPTEPGWDAGARSWACLLVFPEPTTDTFFTIVTGVGSSR